MKNIMIPLIAILVSSCASNLNKQVITDKQEMIEDTIKEDKIIGSDVPSWTRKSGVENGMVYVVGSAEFDANHSPLYVEKAAVMDGEIRLLSDAPTDVRVLTQNALTGVGVNSSEFFQIQTKLQEVIGLTGVRHNQEKVVCRKVIRYGNLNTQLNRICWAQVSVSVRNLMKAYQRTLAMKFGVFKANKFKNIMDDELKRINNNKLLRKDKTNENTTRINRSSGKQSAVRKRLPAQQVKRITKQ